MSKHDHPSSRNRYITNSRKCRTFHETLSNISWLRHRPLLRSNLNLPSNVDIQSIARIETYDASMAEDGEDFCEIRVIDTEEQIVFIERVFSFKVP